MPRLFYSSCIACLNFNESAFCYVENPRSQTQFADGEKVMFSNVSLSLIVVGATLAGYNNTVSEPICCMKRAYCCSVNRDCCPKAAATTNVVGGTGIVASTSTTEPTCCMKRAYCCSINAQCCRHSAAVEKTAVVTAGSESIAQPICCMKRAYCCSVQRGCCPRESSAQKIA